VRRRGGAKHTQDPRSAGQVQRSRSHALAFSPPAGTSRITHIAANPVGGAAGVASFQPLRGLSRNTQGRFGTLSDG
jgi:hypothetical protein